MISYDKRNFRTVQNSGTGEVDSSTVFCYSQAGSLVTATYKGGAILHGQLIARCNEDGVLDMRYQHLNKDGQLMTGTCRSVPEILQDGRIRLHESWQWTSGDGSRGQSVIEEMNIPSSL